MPTNDYADLEVRIRAKAKNAYPVEITCEGKQFLPGRLLVSKQPDRPTGEDLFDWLTGDDNLKLAWAEIQGSHRKRRIRLRIDSDAPELHLLPWESLRDGRDQRQPLDFAAMDATPFSRYIAGQWDPGKPLKKDTVRVLAVISSPTNLDLFGLSPIDAEAEWEVVRNVFTNRKDVELVRMPGPATLAAIEEQMRHGFAILHFVGHGKQSGDKGVIFLENENHTAVAVTDRDFAAMIARQSWDAGRLSLAFLCSCQTASSNDDHAFDGLGPRMIEAGVPAVIAMQARVRIDTARAFATVFYRDLLTHGIIDRAANAARSSLMTSGVGGAAVPVLYMRMEDGLLFDRTVAQPARERPTGQQPTGPKSSSRSSRPAEPPAKSGFLLKMFALIGVCFVGFFIWAMIGGSDAPIPILEYSVSIQPFRDGKDVGDPYPLKKDAPLAKEDHFELKLKALEAGHVYIWNRCLSVGGNPSIATAYPSPAQSSEVTKGQSLRIPTKADAWLRYPSCGAPTMIYIVYSKSAIPEFETWIADKSKAEDDQTMLSGADLDAAKAILDRLKSETPATTDISAHSAIQLKGLDHVVHEVLLNYTN